MPKDHRAKEKFLFSSMLKILKMINYNLVSTNEMRDNIFIMFIFVFVCTIYILYNIYILSV